MRMIHNINITIRESNNEWMNEWQINSYGTHQLISSDLLRTPDGLHPRRHSFLDDNNDNTHNNSVHIYRAGPYASHRVRYQFRAGRHVTSRHDWDGNTLTQLKTKQKNSSTNNKRKNENGNMFLYWLGPHFIFILKYSAAAIYTHILCVLWIYWNPISCIDYFDLLSTFTTYLDWYNCIHNIRTFQWHGISFHHHW